MSRRGGSFRGGGRRGGSSGQFRGRTSPFFRRRGPVVRITPGFYTGYSNPYYGGYYPVYSSGPGTIIFIIVIIIIIAVALGIFRSRSERIED